MLPQGGISVCIGSRGTNGQCLTWAICLGPNVCSVWWARRVDWLEGVCREGAPYGVLSACTPKVG